MPSRLQYDILKILHRLLRTIYEEQRTLLRDGYLNYRLSTEKPFKGSKFRQRHGIQRDYRLHKLNKLVKGLKNCIDHLRDFSITNTACLSHLLTLQTQNEISHELNVEIDKYIALLSPDVTRERGETDRFGNIGLHAQFESLLSLRMLESLSPKILETINQRIIGYLIKHHDVLLAELGDEIFEQMVHFKIPFNKDVDPILALIELFERPLQTIDEVNIPQTICESFILHLLMFNYVHIFDPSKLVDTIDKAAKLQVLRDKYHQNVRPKGENGIFEPNVRGRIEIYSKQKDRTLGITDEDFELALFENFHDFDFTPFKYRSKANQFSPLVKHLRKKGIPFIAGPSGTTADVIESLQFLYPEMSDADYQSYLNLLAASEVALGHHSVAEVILTATQAGVLPQVKLKDLGQPHWEQIDYTNMYRDFLTPEFKETKSYASLKANYPWCLGEPHPLEKKELIKKKKEARLAFKVKKAFEERVAETRFKSAPYWIGSDIPDKFFSETHFLHTLSRHNLDRLRESLGDLHPEEMAFLHYFCAQPIVLTHYTNAAPVIKKSGHLLSHKALSRRSVSFNDSSKEDIIQMQNNHYVFFRFELEHRPFYSRFGEQAITLDGRHPGIYPFLWISLTDMYAPLDPVVIEYVDYADETCREGNEHNPKEWDIAEVDIVSTLRFNYPQTGETHLFHVPNYIFMGEDLMEGIARSILAELRRIGGKMREETLAKFSPGTPLFRDDITHHLNVLLSSLFRVEGKIPRSVALKHTDFVESNVSVLMESAKTGDLMTFRKQLRHFPSTVLEDMGEDLIFNIIHNGHDSLFAFLLHNGYELDDELVVYILQQFACTGKLSINYLTSLVEHGYGDKLINFVDYSTSTLLHHYAARGMLQEVDYLLEQGAVENITDYGGKFYIDYLPVEHQDRYRQALMHGTNMVI